jgi:hypothetical protein
MMKRLSTLLLLFFSFGLSAQSPGEILVGINFDLIKSDYTKYFDKAQVALEGNYFISKKFSATGGVEVWTHDVTSAVLGIRYYPVRDAYIRVRGLIGADDLSVGGGWAKPMTEDLRFESMADFYFTGNFTIRAGLALMIGRKD